MDEKSVCSQYSLQDVILMPTYIIQSVNQFPTNDARTRDKHKASERHTHIFRRNNRPLSFIPKLERKQNVQSKLMAQPTRQQTRNALVGELVVAAVRHGLCLAKDLQGVLPRHIITDGEEVHVCLGSLGDVAHAAAEIVADVAEGNGDGAGARCLEAIGTVCLLQMVEILAFA
jgi:hypothetical protein